jgi:hypothetical protein
MPPSDFSRLSRRRLAAGVCAALALAAFAGSLPSLAASTRWVSFAKGKVEVQLPTSIAVHEDPDGTLTGTFGPGGVNRLELTLLDPQKDARNDTAEQFVEFYARQRNLPVHTNGEKAVVMEGAEGTLEGKKVRIARWQIGFGKTLIVMTLRAPARDALSPELKAFLDQDLEQVIRSVRRKK